MNIIFFISGGGAGGSAVSVSTQVRDFPIIYTLFAFKPTVLMLYGYIIKIYHILFSKYIFIELASN